MKKIIVTGGAGFIGSHIALLLLERGYDVLIFDSFANSSSNVIERIEKFLDNKALKYKLRVINGDIRDKKILESIFSKSSFLAPPTVSAMASTSVPWTSLAPT